MAVISVVSSQYGSASISSGTSTTAAISSVALANSILLVTAEMGSNNSIGDTMFTATLSSSTEITFERAQTDASMTVTFRWQVIEFDSSVNVQHFVVAGSFSPAVNQTITAVDLSRSIIIPTGFRNQGSAAGADDSASLDFTSSTNVQIESVAGTGGQDASFSVVEFPGAAIQSVQRVTGSATTTSTAVSITSVNAAKTLVFATGKVDASWGVDDCYVHKLTSSTNIQLDRRATGGAWDYVLHVVEFVDYDVTHGNQTISSGTASGTEVLGSAPSDPSVILNGVSALPYHLEANDTDDDLGSSSYGATLSGSTYTFTRGNTTGDSYLQYSIIDWGQTAGASGRIMSSLVNYGGLAGLGGMAGRGGGLAG